MTGQEGQSAPTAPAARRRTGALAVASTLLTVAGVVVAVVRPPGLTDMLEAAVREAGAAAPLVYVLLCVLAAPLHLGGVLVALSPVVWPLGTALALSFAGILLGNVLAALLLSRVAGAATRHRGDWPGWWQRLAGGVSRRPFVAGLLARMTFGSGLALEAFYVLTGYSWRQYLPVTLLGTALWVTQALAGVTALRELFRVSSGLTVLAALAPLLIVALALGVRRLRRS